MGDMLGLLRIHIIRGIKLAVRDVKSSDPYIVVKMDKQRLKTKVISNTVNPEWNEDLTLSIYNPKTPITLKVYDKDALSKDDKMGDVELDIAPLIEATKKSAQNGPNGTVITKVVASKKNSLAKESNIIWENGKLTQHMIVTLHNVECGEVELRLQWVNVPGSKSQ